MSPQFAADVGLLLSVTADPVVLFRDMSRSSAQSLHFHSFNDNETPWQQLVFASWADASDRPPSRCQDRQRCQDEVDPRFEEAWHQRACHLSLTRKILSLALWICSRPKHKEKVWIHSHWIP